MGNLCGKESSPTTDAFSQPGRTLAAAPPRPQNPISSIPKRVGGPPQTLGGGGGGGGDSSETSGAQEDARRKAAAAAEARANAANKPKGKLGSQLAEQKRQTRNDTLEALSKDERRLRDADAAADTRAYN